MRLAFILHLKGFENRPDILHLIQRLFVNRRYQRFFPTYKTKVYTSAPQASCNNSHMRRRTYWIVFIFPEWAYSPAGICNRRCPVWGCWGSRRGFSAFINPCLSCRVSGSTCALLKMLSRSSRLGFQSSPSMTTILSVSHPPCRYCLSFPSLCLCCWWTCCSFRTLGIGFNGRGLLFTRRLSCFSLSTALWSSAWSC